MQGLLKKNEALIAEEGAVDYFNGPASIPGLLKLITNAKANTWFQDDGKTEVDLSSISVPVFAIYGRHDIISHMPDQAWYIDTITTLEGYVSVAAGDIDAVGFNVEPEMSLIKWFLQEDF